VLPVQLVQQAWKWNAQAKKGGLRVTDKPQHKMIAKLIGARNEIEDVLRACSRDGTLLSSAERDRLSSILSLIESLLQDLEQGPPNTSASAAVTSDPGEGFPVRT
jgi:hypothetical protein